MALESTYPYVGEGSQCPIPLPSPLNVPLDTKNPYTCLSTPGGAPADEDKLAAWISVNGPVSIAFDATRTFFLFYV